MSTTAIGFRCKDFVLVAVSGTTAFYYIKLHDNEDNVIQLDENKLLAASGEQADVVNYTEYIKRNMALDKMKHNGRPMSTPAAAHYMRSTLSSALRSRSGPYLVNTLVAGYDGKVSAYDDSDPQSYLYYMDYLGTLAAVPFGCHGYGATFVVAILDSEWREDLTLEQGKALMQKCIKEVQKRLIVDHSHFVTKLVDASGVKELKEIH